MLQGLLSPALSGSPEGLSGWSGLSVFGRELFSQWRQHLCQSPLGYDAAKRVRVHACMPDGSWGRTACSVTLH